MTIRSTLLAAAISLLFSGAARSEIQIKYSKEATRQATYETALKAADQPVLGPWQQVGPFAYLLRRVQPPQTNPAPDAEYDVLTKKKAKWADMPEYLDGYENVVNLSGIPEKLFEGNSPSSMCLARTITAPRDMNLNVYLGCDGGFVIWVNGVEALFTDNGKAYEPGQETAVLPLKAGVNRMVMKIVQRVRPCRFFFMPDIGAAYEKELLAKLESDFPTKRTPDLSYRTRAALYSTGAEQNYYKLVELPAPAGTFIEGGGMDFLPDGRLVVSTRRGYIYLVENPGSEDPGKVNFHRYAEVLHEGLGLRVFDGKIHVVQRGSVTRVLDTDKDGTADRYENLNNDWGLTGNYHEYAYGLVRDKEGNMYVPLNVGFGVKGAAGGAPGAHVPYRGWVVRITPDGEMEPFCHGFRSPNGIGQNAAGDMFVTDNQGDWVPVCPLYHIQKDKFYGHPASRAWLKDAPKGDVSKDLPPRTPPAIWFPYEEVSQSATDIVCDRSGGKFGPFADQLFVGDMTKGLVARVVLEKVNGIYQGACMVFRRGVGAVNRMTFGPDGKLYLSRVNRGWGGGGIGDGLARLDFTGNVPMEILSVKIQKDGFSLSFTKPLADGQGGAVSDYNLEQYAYHNWGNYGSPKINIAKVKVAGVEIASDRKSVRLKTEGLLVDRVCQISLGRFTAVDGSVLMHPDAFYTINAIPNQ